MNECTEPLTRSFSILNFSLFELVFALFFQSLNRIRFDFFLNAIENNEMKACNVLASNAARLERRQQHKKPRENEEKIWNNNKVCVYFKIEWELFARP